MRIGILESAGKSSQIVTVHVELELLNVAILAFPLGSPFQITFFFLPLAFAEYCALNC